MPLSGTRLKSTLASDILSQIQAKFPIPGGLLAGEQSGIATAQQNMANAMAAAIGPDVVTEITTNALVPGISSGGGTTVVT